jgi:putative transposase
MGYQERFANTHLSIELGSRRVVHFGITLYPTDAWVAQQLREATSYGLTPRFLIRDRDSKYGDDFTRVAKASPLKSY